MRFSRQGRLYRPTRKLRRLPAAAGGGGSLPARTTVPTYREPYAHNDIGNFPWSAGALVVGDYVVGGAAGYCYPTGQTATVGGTTAPVTEDPLAVIESQDLASLPTTWGACSMYHVHDADTQNAIAHVMTGSNDVQCFPSVAFVGSSVDGTPSLVEHGVMDDVIASSWVLNVDDIEFPVHEVPAGYTFVYSVVRGNDPSTSGTWGAATLRGQSHTLAGYDAACSVATLEGPHDGTGVYWRQSVNSDNVPTRGAFCSIIAVPGT